MKRMLLNKPRTALLLPVVYRMHGKHKFTMVRPPALIQAYETVLNLEKWGIKGDIVEMGCWRGGCSALMAHAAKKGRTKRVTHAFDSFEGLPKPDQADVKVKKKYGKSAEGHLSDASPADVKQAFKKMKLPASSLKIYKGWFKDTTSTIETDSIALLRLDGDLYASTKEALEGLYDKVASGGVIIIDDYNDFGGCRKAVHEFFCERDIHPKLMDYPYGGEKYFRKK